ncbi:MAG: Gfo/Idh/MocA family oxidoreductase [Acidobacteria bacterium]|nr:Gfo/Idh/MocA family oxidoreductase [Acidobacteriota bacterium]
MRKIARRTFAGSLTAAFAAGANDQVSLAFVGTGGMGTAHVKRTLDLKTAQVTAVCDVDSNNAERAGKIVYDATGKAPRTVSDFRRLLDDKSIDAFIIATPHHWHAPVAVAAMKAGKDVYVEKPASHVFREGRVLIDTARQYKRVFQHGTQMRSSEVTAKARELLDSGIIGAVKMSKAWNQQKLSNPAKVPDSAPPPGVDYDLWLGPAPKRGFNPARYNHSSNWTTWRDYGNGSIGDDGIHDLDMARFGLDPKTHPVRITAHGSTVAGPIGEYPDNMTVSYHFEEGKVLLYEERNWTPYGQYGFDSGNAFYGTEGFMVFSRRGYLQVYLGRKEEKGPGMQGGSGHPGHFANFLDCVRSRQQPIANAEVAHRSCALVHLGEIAYRVGRVLHFDPATETVRDDAQANALLTKSYRPPFGF